jgi:hypothetical protein
MRKESPVTLRRSRCLTAVAAAVLLVSGCGSLGSDDVENVATAFARAGDDPAGRCELLAPKTLETLVEEESSPCEDAIGDLPLGTGDLTSVEVWGEEAQAKLADDTLFLTRTSDGWRVMAAACSPQGPEQPYECQLESS